MKLAYYALGSAASAAGVVIYAFNQRANFYSACVYLAQSNLCLMILINLILLTFGSFVLGLQRLFYGPLRPIEVEQLYEKAWFAVTETCLAMTMFRDEVGAWFLVMFVALLTGKVWGWIGDGRVEILEQQPPANPRLFHIRLSLSLALSLIYDSWLLYYAVSTVIQQARPNMMVMFLFEFAVLTISSWSTALRYGISLLEANIVKKQTAERMEERRREIREERDEILRQRAATAENAETDAPDEELPALPSEDDIDEMDLEVPGWEAKGHWILTLDLFTDFMKLGIYSAFFFIILTFYGLPIHIMRDLFLTARSFVKRLTAFLRYRRATHLMNERYQDATAEDLAREDTCIVCREEMRPWGPPNQNPPAAANDTPQQRRPSSTVNERTRPKKLPCGHILHLGCLKSWLERQQVCPTCRAPVVEQAQQPNGPPNQGVGAQQPQPPPQLPPQQGPGNPPPPQPGPRPNGGMRMLNLGPLRVGFGQPQDLLQQLQQAPPGVANAVPTAPPRMYGVEVEFPRRQQGHVDQATLPHGRQPWQTQLASIEGQILQEIRSLQVAREQLHVVQALEEELARLRAVDGGLAIPHIPRALSTVPTIAPVAPLAPLAAFPHHPLQLAGLQRHGAIPGVSAIPAGSPDLPPGVSIPDGWSLLPLQRVENPGGLGPNLAAGGSAATSTSHNPSVPQSVNTAAGSSETPRIPTPAIRSETPEPGAAPNDYTESIARLQEQRNMIHQLPEETRSLADRLIQLETNALRQRASAESLSDSFRAPNLRTSQGAPANLTTNEPGEPPQSDHGSNVSLNWGSSQFFSGPSSSSDPVGPTVSAAESAGQAEHEHEHEHESSVDGDTNDVDEEDSRSHDKGKALPVTVEDVSDDSEADV